MKHKKTRFFKIEAARRATQTKTTNRLFEKKAPGRATQTKMTNRLFKKKRGLDKYVYVNSLIYLVGVPPQPIFAGADFIFNFRQETVRPPKRQ